MPKALETPVIPEEAGRMVEVGMMMPGADSLPLVQCELSFSYNNISNLFHIRPLGTFHSKKNRKSTCRMVCGEQPMGVV